MKFLVALTILALATGAFALTDEQIEKGDEYAKECIGTTGADPKVVAGLKTGDFSNRDEKTLCFAKCILEKSGFIDKDGNFQEAVAREKLIKGDNKEKVEAAIEACKDKKGDSLCETAFNIYQCYYTTKHGAE